MGEASNHKAQIVLAPSRPDITGRKSVFLAGTTSGNDWRGNVVRALSHLPVTVYNPLRTDWDSSWREDPSFKPFREQVDWELEMQEKADVIVIYFGAGTDAPISLLELGLCARSGKAIVAFDPKYRKRGNVLLVAERFGLKALEGGDRLAEEVVKRLEGLLEGKE
ncbi:hypothetical protein V8F20_001319 [Naviculisporaceae sp. PSN 640]